MKFRSELEKLYVKYNPTGYSISKIAKIISEKHKEVKLSKRSIEVNLGEIKRENSNVIEVNDLPLWEVRDKDYLIQVNSKVKKYPISFIDKLFLHYSRSGYNFSRTKLCNRFDLSVRAFGEIQRAFFLYKDANILSPWTMENTPSEELKLIMDTQTTKVLRSGEITEQKYQEGVIREYKKVINEDNKNNLRIQEMLHELSIKLPKLELGKLQTNASNHNPELVISIADLHIGAKNHEKLTITEDYSIAIAKEKLARIASIINSYKSKKVHIAFLADLVESLSGLNHIDSWKQMESNITGWKSISVAYEIIIQFLNSIENLGSINGVAGNHDRSQKSHDESDTLVTDAIFYMLGQYYLNSSIKINYNPTVASLSVEGQGYIFMHGHLGTHKRKVSDLILDFAANPREFQFIISGHWHTRILERGDDTNRGRKITCPSIFTGNKYSDDLGVACKSGFLLCGNDEYGQPFCIDRAC